MKFLTTLGDTKPTPLLLMDMAIIISILPLFVVLKAPMILFLFISIIFIVLKKEALSQSKTLFILVLGLIAMYLALYGSFNLQGLSRLKLFLELLIYILLTVVAMQRLTRTINFYLLMSPMLFLSLSLFFFHSALMLIYVIFEIFFLLWMILSHRMQSSLIESFRVSMVMFLYSLPWVVILFIFFPRISFEHASYGFKGENIHRMGHDGTMFLDSDALLVPSNRIVMEINFEKKVPENAQLYFRGSILYFDKKNHWEPLPVHLQHQRNHRIIMPSQGERVEYIVTLYPTHKKWLYLLDTPFYEVKNTHLDKDFITTTKKNIIDPIHYKATSYLNNNFVDKLDFLTKKSSLGFDKTSNLRTFKEAKKIKNLPISTKEKIQKMIDFFKHQKLTYTLKPKLLDINNTTDSFLFDKKLGYCVHFSSSFVIMARMVGIPARIVTGYKADKSNSYKKYLSVKEKDAHAWAEVYIKDRWIRIETTATAFLIQDNQVEIEENKKLTSQINLYLRYIKYQVDTWILNYSNIRQLQLLKYAKTHPTFIFGFVLTLITLMIGTLFFISYFKKQRQENEILSFLFPLIKQLEKEHYYRQEKETLHHYFQRYIEKNSLNKEKVLLLRQIDKYYEEILYANDHSNEKKKALKEAIKSFLGVSKSHLLSLFK